jgi:acetyl esterase/lipase
MSATDELGEPTDRAHLGAARYSIERHDEVFATPDGVELMARVWVPVDAPPGRPAVVDAHGGCWAYFDRTVDESQCRGLAEAGAVSVAVDFRQAPEGRWPDPVADVAAGVRWVKANAERFSVDPDAVLLLGGSSGGHLAMWVALRPEHPETTTTAHLGGESAVDGPDARVRGVLALWPIAAPDDRYRYLQRRQATGDTESRDPLFNLDFLLGGHDAFFGDLETMAAASVLEVLASGDHEPPPPLWLAHPELDENVLRAMSEQVLDAWRAAGGTAGLQLYEGLGHGFVNFGGPAAEACVADMVTAARAHLEARP